ncbi:MAG: hypothetical protein HGA87_01075 [Desulfobulbaceae bacterium]|nr:hypothetical protein [Desulfobulbaceae bacterium]
MSQVFSARISDDLAIKADGLLHGAEKRGDFIAMAIANEINRRLNPVKLARKSDPDTSKLAAMSVNVTKNELLVLDYIGIGEKKTQAEIKEAMYYSDETCHIESVHKRISGLLSKGFLADTGERRKGDAGRWQRVYRRIK